VNGPGAVNDTLLCTTYYSFKPTRLFKIRRTGVVQIRSRATGCGSFKPSGLYSHFHAHIGGAQYKIRGRMEDLSLPFELVDIRPRRRLVVAAEVIQI
jgi:hypothetical protein